MVSLCPFGKGHRHVYVVKFGVDDKSGGSINRVLKIVPIQRCRADMGRIARNVAIGPVKTVEPLPFNNSEALIDLAPCTRRPSVQQL